MEVFDDISLKIIEIDGGFSKHVWVPESTP